MHIYGSRKKVLRTYFQESNRDADIENRLMDTLVEGGDEMNWESNNEAYTLPHVK